MDSNLLEDSILMLLLHLLEPEYIFDYLASVNYQHIFLLFLQVQQLLDSDSQNQ